MTKAIQLAASIIICQLAGIIGSVYTARSVSSWFAEIKKPAFSPPNWLFGPVWITFYTLMGVSLYLVWQKRGEVKTAWLAIFLFLIQLAFNALWSFLFFGLRSPGWAFLEIIVLWLMILALIFMFYEISKIASWLLVPYLLWVSFAAFLNFSIWRLN